MTFAYDSEIHDKLIQHFLNFSDFQFSIMNYALKLWINFGRSGYRRRAFRYIFARIVFVSILSSRYKLAKDAAPIPNAEGLQ